jgi:peptide-methionine (R)-S-oxide reductase
MKKRVLISLLILLSLGGGIFWYTQQQPTEVSKESLPVNLSEEEWRTRLTPEEFRVLREAGTERAGTSPLNKETRSGTFACAGCGKKLFSSETKYKSGTGWPSFYMPLPGGVETETDYKLVVPRTEVHCADCGGHLGHVFKDGPQPTGLRYCMNGVALKFQPDE